MAASLQRFICNALVAFCSESETALGPHKNALLQAIRWMEGRFTAPDTSLVVVTHDRAFMEAVCTSVLELDAGEAHLHAFGGPGSYDRFREARALHLAPSFCRIHVLSMRKFGARRWDPVSIPAAWVCLACSEPDSVSQMLGACHDLLSHVTHTRSMGR
jgi:hypothetical protein